MMYGERIIKNELKLAIEFNESYMLWRRAVKPN